MIFKTGDRVVFTWAGMVNTGYVIGEGSTAGTWAVLFRATFDMQMFDIPEKDITKALPSPQSSDGS